MSTIESLEPRIYLLLETRSKAFASSDDVQYVVLFVNGVASTFMMILPTADITLALLSEHDLLQWIELAEGDALHTCDLPAQQNLAILTLLYAYRACYYQIGVSPSDVSLLFHLITEAAMSLDEHEPADTIIEELAAYVRDTFPVNALTSLPMPDADASASVATPHDGEEPVPRSLPAPASIVAGMRVCTPCRSARGSNSLPPQPSYGTPTHASPTSQPSTPMSEHTPALAADANAEDAPSTADSDHKGPFTDATRTADSEVITPTAQAAILAPTGLTHAAAPDLVPAPNIVASVLNNFAPFAAAPAVIAPPINGTALPSFEAAFPSTSITVERAMGSGRGTNTAAVSADDGYESDDSCPSLQSVADSSDDWEEAEDGHETMPRRILALMAFLHAELEEHFVGRRV